ncbi:MAG: aspartyl-trna synthetase [Silicimonas sp.]|nr:aspartyl-trna synthetase [Silicimonas sp.]
MRMRAAILFSLAILNATSGAVVASERGKVTNLPIPRYVSLKAEKGNARRGPSLSHRIDWVFQRRNMPLQVTGEHGHWRRVQDRDGQGGWVHYSLISGARHVIVEADMTPLYVKPDASSPVNAYVEAGVVARLGKCDLDWCRVSAKGSKGWASKRTLWGVLPEELRD